MRTKLTTLIVLCCVVIPVQAGYSVKVNSVPNLLHAAGAIAVLPATCPPQVDCVWLDAKVAKELARYTQLKVIDTDAVTQVMFNLGIDSVGPEHRAQLSKSLGVDSLLMVRVGHSEVTKEVTGYKSTGYRVRAITEKIAKGTLEVSIVSTKTGKPLMKGKGFAESEFRGGKGVLGKTFQKILRKAFGKPN